VEFYHEDIEVHRGADRLYPAVAETGTKVADGLKGQVQASLL